ncbi:hypothetical protein CY0110_16192 [Crocosphaera chwakensis CCY0110]|uniref:Uncharacterized protein n=1 Tax=Crocosphaera chwakensis CCY0110 TaxID=391612 RepID=A3IHS0_9CHRO|nr:hypothetical protein CY0110_16192 [Crocosphaera chwakensis CCY0110]
MVPESFPFASCIISCPVSSLPKLGA